MHQDKNDFCPDWASPPGDTICSIIKERKISLRKLSHMMSIPYKDVCGLLNGTKVIDKNIAFKLSSILGASPGFWLRRDETYRKDLIRLGLK